MAVGHRKTVYGIGCITEKETRPDYRYLYAEWSVKGKHECKSCGNAADPNSRRRAMGVLREAALARVAELQSELDLLSVALESDEGG